MATAQKLLGTGLSNRLYFNKLDFYLSKNAALLLCSLASVHMHNCTMHILLIGQINGKNKSGAYKYKLILHKGRLRILLVTEKLATKVKYWHGHRIKDDE